jgi:hypothetical protein
MQEANLKATSAVEAEYYSASTAGYEVSCTVGRTWTIMIPVSCRNSLPVYEDHPTCIELGNKVIGGLELTKNI